MSLLTLGRFSPTKDKESWAPFTWRRVLATLRKNLTPVAGLKTDYHGQDVSCNNSTVRKDNVFSGMDGTILWSPLKQLRSQSCYDVVSNRTFVQNIL